MPSSPWSTLPIHMSSQKGASITPFSTTKRADSWPSLRLAKIMPVSAALMARESFMPESAVRRLPCATTAIAAAKELKSTRNIMASTEATPRRDDAFSFRLSAFSMVAARRV